MEGLIARWYTNNSGRDPRRFVGVAEAVAARLPAGGRVLEVAPGPGYLSIELARRGYKMAAIDISHAFVPMARENAARAGVAIDVRDGDAAALPFAAESFEMVVCAAAFKNFSDPAWRWTKCSACWSPAGLRRCTTSGKRRRARRLPPRWPACELSTANTALTRWIFRGLVKIAYARDVLRQLADRSTSGASEILPNGIGFELRLLKRPPPAPRS
jgi:ubiquinone/menaquinone biosynthesis C-methylase UbiE